MTSLHEYFKKQMNKAIEKATSAYNFETPEDYLLYQQCRKEFKKRKILTILKMEYDMKEAFAELKTIEDATSTRLKQYKADKRLDSYIFLTISPPEETKFTDMVKCIERAVKRKFVKQYHYVFEQRGTNMNNVGKGKHIHLLFKRDINYKPAIIKRDLKNTFKKLYGKNTISDYNFNFKKCGEEYYKLRLLYLKGNKTEEGKAEKCQLDLHFRKLYKLKSIYEN
jgi:hypothetical protein